MDFVYYQAPVNASNSRRKDEDNGGSSIPRADVDNSKPSSGAQSAEKRTDPIASSAEENEEPEVSTRPRLTREQVFLLEQQFQAAPKPSANTKRKLAETTGLSMPRVGNWFQNRRAKAKQQKKQVEAEIRRTIESGRRNYTEPSSPNFYYYPNFPLVDIDQWAQLHSVLVEHPNSATYGGNQYNTPSEASYASLSRSIAAATAAVVQGRFDDPMEIKPEASAHSNSSFYPYAAAPGGDVQYAISSFSDYDSSRASSVVWTPTAGHREDSFDMNNLNVQQLQVQQSTQQQQQSLQDVYSKYPAGAEAVEMREPLARQISHSPSHFRNPFLVPALPSQVLREKQYGQAERESQPDAAAESSLSRRDSCSSDLVNSFNVVDLQTKEQEFTPQETDGPVNIAARRNRPRPATLALRGRSFMGNVPVSPTVKAQFLGPASPMHRMKSTGNSLNLMRGRVQKGMPSSTQRSPLNFETFLAASAFQESQVNGISPTTTATPGTSVSINGSLAPPTPSTPLDLERLQSEGVNNSGDPDASYIYSPEYPGCFVPTTVEMHTNLASPPTTPLDVAGYINMARYQQSHRIEPSRLSPHSGSDETLVSPEFTSYPSTIHMPQPVYVSPINCGDSDMASLLQFNDAHGGNMDIFCSSAPAIPGFFYQEPSPIAPSFASQQPPLPPKQQQHAPSQNTPSRELLPKPKKYAFTTNQGPEDFYVDP